MKKKRSSSKSKENYVHDMKLRECVVSVFVWCGHCSQSELEVGQRAHEIYHRLGQQRREFVDIDGNVTGPQ